MKKITKDDLLKSPDYWLVRYQTKLYGILKDYMQSKGLKKKQLAVQLGVTPGYVSQILNGDFDHKLSKFIALALEAGRVPVIDFIPLDRYREMEEIKSSSRNRSKATLRIVSGQNLNLKTGGEGEDQSLISSGFQVTGKTVSQSYANQN